MLLVINVFLLIFNVFPRETFCQEGLKEIAPKEGSNRNGRVIGLLGLLAGLNIVDSFEEDDEPEHISPVVMTKRTPPEWLSSLKVAFVDPNGQVELLTPTAYHDLLLHYPQYYNDRHGASIQQTIKLSSSSIKPSIHQPQASPIVTETTVVNNLPDIVINKGSEFASRKNKKQKLRTQKFMETTTEDDFETTTDFESTTHPLTFLRKKKETEVTTLPPIEEDEETTELVTESAEITTTTEKSSQPMEDSQTEGSSLSQILIPPSHTIAIFKPTVPMKGAGYGNSVHDNLDKLYLTTEMPMVASNKFKRHFRPSPRDYYLDKYDGFYPLYFRNLDSNIFEFPSNDVAESTYQLEPLLN